MIITNKQIQHMINEEFDRAINERKKTLLKERFRGNAELHGMEAYDLIRFGKAYAKMGNAVQEQLDKLLDDPDSNCNSGAVEMMKENLGGANEEIDAAIAMWEKVRHGGSEDDDELGDDELPPPFPRETRHR